MTNLMHNIPIVLPTISGMGNSLDFLNILLGNAPVKGMVLAQQVSDPEILDRIKSAWDYFIASGQVWALIVGIILGYLFRGFRGT